jgi:hypothetical protein
MLGKAFAQLGDKFICPFMMGDDRQHIFQSQDLFFVGPRLAVTFFGFLILGRKVGRHKASQSRIFYAILQQAERRLKRREG